MTTETKRTLEACPNCGGDLSDFTAGTGETWIECRDCEMRFYPPDRTPAPEPQKPAPRIAAGHDVREVSSGR